MIEPKDRAVPNQAPDLPPEVWLAARLRRHIGEMARLSGPIVINRLGILMIVTTDIVMVGRYSTAELAFQAIGLATIIPILLGGLGLVMGTLVVTARAYGEGDFEGCGAAWRRSLLLAAAVGVIIVAYCGAGEWLLLAFGQDPDLAAGGGRFMLAIGLGLPGQLMFMNSGFFLEAIRRPFPGMLVMIAGNLLNVALNWLMVFGNGGFEAAGAEGAAWATTIVRWCMALVLLAYVWTMRDHDTFAIRRPAAGGWADWKQQRRIGYATAISIGVEATAFASLSIMAGWLGTLPLGAYTIAHNLLALVFMMAIGLGSATSVRVGIAHGRRDARDLMLAGWTGLGLTVVVMAAGGGLFAAFPAIAAGIYTEDAALAAMAVPLFGLTAVVLLADGGQAALASALRGRQDIWLPTAAQTFAYFGVLVPTGYVLGIQLERGARGLMEAILVASIVSIILLGSRFHILAMRDRREMAPDRL